MWRIFLIPARDDKRNIHVNDWRRSILSHSANAFSYVIHLSHATGVTVLEHKCWSNRLTDQSSLWHQYDIFQWTSVCSQTVLLFIGKEKDLHLVMRAPPMGSLGKKFNQWSSKRRSGCLSSKSMISLSVKLPKVSPGVREDHVRLTESRPAWVLILPDERNRQGVPTDEQERASQRGTSLFIPGPFDFCGNWKTRKRQSINLIHPYPIVNAKSHYFHFSRHDCLLVPYTQGFKSSLFIFKTKQPLENGKVLKPILLGGF